jgi:hypothetical protein
LNILNLRAGLGMAIALIGSLPAMGGTITFSCASNIDAANAGTCATLNGTIAGLYSSTFTDANASIYIQYGTTGLGSSVQFNNTVSYGDYYTALDTHQSGANDATAVGSLGGGITNPVIGGYDVSLTSALTAALGLSGGIGIDSTPAGNACTLGNAGCYNGIITMTDTLSNWFYRSGVQSGSQYDFYEVAQHEVNEVLGASSCITTGAGPAPSLGCTGPNATGAADLFRYSATGTRSFVAQGNGTLAYFSIDGGVTNIAGYNNSPNNGDYGDWSAGPNRVQNAFGSPGVPGVDITTDGGSEIKVLDAVGYNLVTTNVPVPEPAAASLFGSGLLLLAGIAYRRRRV